MSDAKPLPALSTICNIAYRQRERRRESEDEMSREVAAARRICTERWNGRSNKICRRWARWRHKIDRTWYLCDDHKCDGCRKIPHAAAKVRKA